MEKKMPWILETKIGINSEFTTRIVEDGREAVKNWMKEIKSGCYIIKNVLKQWEIQTKGDRLEEKQVRGP